MNEAGVRRADALRVAMVTARSLPFMGGVETHVEEVSRRLAARGVVVTVLSTDVTGALDPFEERDGFVIRRFPAWPKSKDYYFSPSLLRELGRGDFDLVHVQGVHTAIPPTALAAAHRRGLPALLTFHTGGSSNRVRRMLRGAQWQIERPVLGAATRLIAVCEYEAQLFSKALRVPVDRIGLIRNGAGGLPATDRVAEFAGDPLVLSIGRLERYKGHHRVIDAMPSLLASAPGARLVIVGVGPFAADLRSRVAERGLEASVSFTSYEPGERDRLAALVRASDVVALLSEYEAHPVAVMEALAERIDVVVAATSGLRELGRSGLVRTVELDDAPDLVAREILDAANERRWANAPAPLPSWEGCVDALLTAYREVVGCGS